MQIEPGEANELREKLASPTWEIPPNEVVCAAAALVNSAELGLVYSERSSGADGSRWSVFAVVGNADLLVIEADSPLENWCGDQRQAPQDGAVKRARRVPAATLGSIDVASVRSVATDMGGGWAYRVEWSLRWRNGDEPVRLSPISRTGEQRFGAIRAAIAAASEADDGRSN